VKITIEGVDFTGKSTLVKNLTKTLRDNGKTVLAIKEPGQTEVGKKIRSLIMNNPLMEKMTRMFLFLADRAETAIKYMDYHEKYDYLLSDRGYLSGIAYTLAEETVIRGDIEYLTELATQDILPHLVVLITIDEKTLQYRMNERGAENFLDNVSITTMLQRQRTMEFVLASADNVPYISIDAGTPHQKIVEQVIKAISYVEKEGEGVKDGEISYNC
jgi:dTMP kinase